MNFEFYTLKNGVRVVLVPMAGVESVAIGVYIKTGSRYETEKINGLSHFLEHMVFKGTTKFPSHQETSYLEGLGAIQNAWTDVDATAYWCKIVADKWKEGLELEKELALNPLFPQKDLEIERGVILEEINRRDDRPDEMVQEVLQESLFPQNPLGMSTLGLGSVIKAVNRDDFVAYHSIQYVAGRIAVVMAGKIGDSKQIREVISEWFGGLADSAGRSFEPLSGITAGPEAKARYKKTADQIHFEMGLRCFDSTDQRRFPLTIMTSYLGQGLSSRLFTELREKRGLCYEVNSAAAYMEDTGVWSVYAGVAKEKFPAAAEAVWEEIKRLKSDLLGARDLTAAKEKIRGQLVFSKENPIHQMEFYARQVLDKPQDMIDYDILVDSLNKVTREEIRDVCRELFILPNIKLAVVGEIGEAETEEIVGNLKD